MVSRKGVEKQLYGSDMLGDSLAPKRGGALSGRFMVPPFTTLNARDGWWAERKRVWLSLGIQSELGRGHDENTHSVPVAAGTKGGMNNAVFKKRVVPKGSDEPEPEIEQQPDQVETAEQQPEAQPVATVAEVKVPKPRARAAAAPKVEPKRKFAAPTVKVTGVASRTQTSKTTVLELPFVAEVAKYGDNKISFDEETWYNPGPRGAVGLDVEVYKNFFLINFTHFGNGRKISFEYSERSSIDWATVRDILDTNCIITFNGTTFDLPMVYIAMRGADNRELKEAANRIIFGNLKRWDVECEFDIKIPNINHVDLLETNPSVRQSLKTLYARLHGKLIMDLPYDPEKWLSFQEMNVATMYCFNDIEALQILFNALKEPLLLRIALGKQYKMDMRSKSDAQVGEAIVKARVEGLTGQRIKRFDDPYIPNFNYNVPDFVSFTDPQMVEVVEQLKKLEFSVNGFEVVAPPYLKDLKIRMGESTYAMGIGGLHSTEANRSVHADDDHYLIDIDVASQYPSIIVKLGLYPKAVGQAFVSVYSQLVHERLEAKDRLKVVGEMLKSDPTNTALLTEKTKLTVQVEGSKIALNGVYGKLGSAYSFLYAPHLLIATTLTGQLSLLMMIERAEAIGVSVVSGNTDGLVMRCPKGLRDKLFEVIAGWEQQTGFKAEVNYYKALYNSSVNTYIAIKEDGKDKRKGPIANPWKEKDLRGQLSKNPQMTVCSEAVLDFIKIGSPIDATVKGTNDIRDFVTTIKVDGGATWRGNYLGKVVRYYWSTDGDPILTNKTTAKGNQRQVAKTAGAKPLMELPDELPNDIDYDKYIAEAKELAVDLGVTVNQSGIGL